MEKIKASELRIGNMVYFRGKETSICLFDFATWLDTNPELYSPIPLTEEWLKRFGFKQGGISATMGYSSYTYFLNEFTISYNTFEGMGCKMEGDDEFVYYMNKIKFVHQLQNIYYFLEGNELLNI